MDGLKWDLLTEVQGRWQADLLKSYLAACGIDSELFQESAGQYLYPTSFDMLGKVQIFVPKENLEDAKKILEEYNNLDATQESE